MIHFIAILNFLNQIIIILDQLLEKEDLKEGIGILIFAINQFVLLNTRIFEALVGMTTRCSIASLFLLIVVHI